MQTETSDTCGGSSPGWHLGPGRVLTLDRPRIMGILNVTPDSFYDGGRLPTPELAADRAQQLADQGADILDVGGESTRPGSTPVPPEEQIRRVVPVIEHIRARGLTIAISTDTTSARVARAAIDAGTDCVNDVSAGQADPGMLPLVADTGLGLVMMHRLKPPAQDSYSTAYTRDPEYNPGVVQVVRGYLRQRAEAAARAGVNAASILLDPGLGFGKSVEQNAALIRGTPQLRALGYPVLSALSRKSFVGALGKLPEGHTPADRLEPTLALSVLHLVQGAMVFRVHDVDRLAAVLSAAWSVLSDPSPPAPSV